MQPSVESAVVITLHASSYHAS